MNDMREYMCNIQHSGINRNSREFIDGNAEFVQDIIFSMFHIDKRDRYYRLNFKPYIPKIDYFYFNRLSKEYENIDPDKSKRYHELTKKFEARINYYLQDIANHLDEYHKNMTTDFGNEEESYRNWINAVAEQYKKYYLTDDVTVISSDNDYDCGVTIIANTNIINED